MLQDEAIIAMLIQRDEQALQAVSQKYGSHGRELAQRILGSRQEAEECLNDALLRLWNAVPPARPQSLYAYFCTIVRRLAFNRFEKSSAQKRGAGQTAAALEELQECLASAEDVPSAVEQKELIAAINRFLQSQSPEAARLFMQRYGYLYTVAQIAAINHIGESKVKVSLHRTRNRLQAFLKKEGLL